jgi:hypothetical protein
MNGLIERRTTARAAPATRRAFGATRPQGLEFRLFFQHEAAVFAGAAGAVSPVGEADGAVARP